MKKIKVGINGFGRIGRAAFKIMLERNGFDVVAVNDLTDVETLAHLLQYDSVYGKFQHGVAVDGAAIKVDKETFQVFSEKDPSKLPWASLGVDVVLECTGIFRTSELAQAHIEAGAKNVIISAPAKDGETPTVVKGVNEEVSGQIVSNASCTTNCIAPVAQVMHEVFGVKKACMTTIHAYTADQRLVDAPHKDKRRGRAAAQNIIPTTTGAAIATTKVIPELQGLFDGMAVRVPVACGSLADFVFVIDKQTTVKEVNEALEAAARQDRYKGILEVTNEPLVSSDVIGNQASSVVDLNLTNVIDGDLVKVVAWYDNEWAYSNRLVDMAARLA